MDLLTYSFPQTKPEIDAIDWTAVVPGRKDTYPQGPDPSKEDFAKVKAVHKLINNKNIESRGI